MAVLCDLFGIVLSQQEGLFKVVLKSVPAVTAVLVPLYGSVAHQATRAGEPQR
jgi:hypothetical protein